MEVKGQFSLMKRHSWIGIALLSSRILSAQAPTVVDGGVLNSASFAKDAQGHGTAVAPGSLVSIFGTNLGSTVASADTVPFSTSLGGVNKVTFNGIAAPLRDVVPTGAFPFINAQMPFGVLPAGQTSGTVNVVVTVNGVASQPKPVPVVSAAPGIFSIPPTGQGTGILVFVDPADSKAKIAAPVSASGSIGFATAPIPRGTRAFFYATGLGVMTPPVNDGDADLTVTHFAVTPIVLVGGITAQVEFAGQAPGYPGAYQVNIVVPEGAPAGDAVSLQIKTADLSVSSNTVTVAVR